VAENFEETKRDPLPLGFSQENKIIFEQKSEQLIKDRKAAKAPDSYTKKSELKAFTQTSEQLTSAAIIGVDLIENRLLVSLADGT